MDEIYERSLFFLEDTHWWYRGRRRVVDELLRQAAPPQHARMLDVGCGTGRNLVELQHYGDPIGVEPSRQAVALAVARGLPVTEGDAANLQFDDATFDVVTALDVIEHIDDDRCALREMYRVATPGGTLVVTVPAFQSLWSSHDEMNLHRRRYRQARLRSALCDSGWYVERLTYFNSALFVPIAIHRLVQRIVGGSTSERNDFTRTPDRFNGVLTDLLSYEARLIGSGRKFPFGVSLAALARRPVGH